MKILELTKRRPSGINTYQIVNESGEPCIVKNKNGFVVDYGVRLIRELT